MWLERTCSNPFIIFPDVRNQMRWWLTHLHAFSNGIFVLGLPACKPFETVEQKEEGNLRLCWEPGFAVNWIIYRIYYWSCTGWTYQIASNQESADIIRPLNVCYLHVCVGVCWVGRQGHADIMLYELECIYYIFSYVYVVPFYIKKVDICEGTMSIQGTTDWTSLRNGLSSMKPFTATWRCKLWPNEKPLCYTSRGLSATCTCALSELSIFCRDNFHNW